MRPLKMLFVSTFFFYSCSHSAAEELFPGIKKLMSEEEFRKAGLDKQSKGELDALNEWLIKYTAKEAEFVKRDIKEVKKVADTAIQSRIKGKFNGWTGNTIFILENGQIWEQRLGGSWKTDIENPEVIIEKNFFGFYVMKIIEKNKKIGVKRVN